MEYQDRTLTCVECGAEFVFSADDQQFHAGRGYQDPKRCPGCRQARRMERREGGQGFGRTMYDAVCASCGNPAQVPFAPRLDRPVYCSDCFAKVRPSRRSW